MFININEMFICYCPRTKSIMVTGKIGVRKTLLMQRCIDAIFNAILAKMAQAVHVKYPWKETRVHHEIISFFDTPAKCIVLKKNKI